MQHRHQAVAWIFLDAFSQNYSKNKEQTEAEQKDLENFQFGQKKRTFKHIVKKDAIAEEIIT